MSTEVSEADLERMKLRQQANYWKAQHGRAVEREQELRRENGELREILHRQEREIREQSKQIEAMKEKLIWLQRQVFGRRTEKTESRGGKKEEDDEGVVEPGKKPGAGQRKRGKQPGTKGNGRKRREELPREEITHELSQGDRCCPRCAKPYIESGGTEDSEEIDWEVRVVRLVHKRKRYKRTCGCDSLPLTVTAPRKPKLIPKGLFTVQFWVRILMEKYLFQRPLYRVRQVLELEGLSVSQGTLTGGLRRIGELLQPLYVRILEHSREAQHWHMDETRWMVFVEIDGKASHRWWLWVVVSEETCVFLLDKTRSSRVPQEHLGEEAEGILSVDRYSAYKSLGENIRLAFCWTHVRRDFIRIRDGSKKHRGWAEQWVERINAIYEQNNKRLELQSKAEAFAREDQALRDLLAEMAKIRDAELADETLNEKQHKALTSLRNHWEGLMIFVDHPEIPMDNNEAERRLRNPVVGRKNYYGSGSVWSGFLTAMLFTLLQTTLKNEVDPKAFLEAYFQACAENGGQAPKDLDDFLPWNLSDEKKDAWRHPKRGP